MGLILYNPSLKEIKFINTYINNIKKVYIYDNSSVTHENEIVENIKASNYEYFFNGENEGISVPFNNMMRAAENETMDYMLLLDQDSKMEPNGIQKAKKIINDNISINVFSCNVIFEGGTKKYLKELEKVKFAITSGTIVNVNYFNTLNGYDEKLFIDGVDRDFCIQLEEKRESIYRMNNVFLFQQLGSKPRNMVGIYEHSPIRNYYIFRNRLYLLKKYPTFFRGVYKFKSKQLSIIKQ